MDEPVNSPDPLDKNIAKLVRGAKSSEPARPGAQARIFQKVIKRLEAEQPALSESNGPAVKKSQFWTIAAAAAACIALGVLLFAQYFVKMGRAPVAEHRPVPQIPETNPKAFTSTADVKTPPPPLAASPTVFQIETADGETKNQTLADGSVLDVAANSRVEILTRNDKTHRPEIRIRSGEVCCDIPRGPGRVLIHSSAGDVLATAAQVKITLSKNAPAGANETAGQDVPKLEHPIQGGESTGAQLAAAAPKTVMNVAVIRGEAIVREAVGSEKLVLAGETASVGGQSETSSAVAENWRSGELIPKLDDGTPGQPLQVRRHSVKATITEQIALVEVDEVFFNPGNQRIEGTFVFPLPHDATICRLAMYVGDNLMEGEIAEAQRARRTFEALKVQRVDPALLEWAGGNTFKMRVFPIEPQSEKRVLISYYEVLKKDHGRVNFTYPLASDVTQKSPVGEIDIAVSIDSTPDIQSAETPGYANATIKAATHHFDAVYQAKNSRPTQDFSVQYQTGKNAPLVTVPYWHARRNEGYFVMIFSPEFDETSSDKHKPSDFVFVVDKSGGIGARQLALAVQTVKDALSYLTPTDHFGIVAYDTAAQKFRTQLIAATPQAVSDAGAWLDGLDAFGASDLTQAWKAAAELSAAGTTQIVYTGSGLSTLTSTQSGTLLADADAAFAGKDVRIHCLPLGTVQDLTFLNELARKYSGTVRPIKDAGNAASATAELLQDFAWPLYKNVQLEFNGISTDEVYPLALPNVTAGRQLLVFGKYKNPAAGTVKLTASRDGQPFAQEVNVNLGLDASHTFVPKLWATRRIAQLQLDAATAAPDDAQKIVADVIETSKRYRVMSQYTSFLVLETPEDYLRYGIERRPDEFDPNASQDIPELALSELNGGANENTREFNGQKLMVKRHGAIRGADNQVYQQQQAEQRRANSLQEANEKQLDGLDKDASNGDSGKLFKMKKSVRDLQVDELQVQSSEALRRSPESAAAQEMEQSAMPAAEATYYINARESEKDLKKGVRRNFYRRAIGVIGTLAWERQDIFPLIESHALPPWNPQQPHSTEPALKILKSLCARIESLSLTMTTYAVDKDGKEHKEGREQVLIFDRATGAFASRCAGADFADLCDGKQYVRLFPQLKYAVRRAAAKNDLRALGSTLPGYLLPWAEMLDNAYVASVEKDADDGIILRLQDRSADNTSSRYALVYLNSRSGPVSKVETYERQRAGNQFEFVKTETLFCENEVAFGDVKIPTSYRLVRHGDKDVVVSIVRLTDVKANFKPDADVFKAEIGADWAVRNQDSSPAPHDQHSLSSPVNPSPNFTPRRR